MNLRGIVFRAVDDERERQNKKWGEQNHGDLYWLGILVEEVGELSQAIIQDRFSENVEKELLHVIAVAVSWAECHLRHTGSAVALREPQVKFDEQSR